MNFPPLSGSGATTNSPTSAPGRLPLGGRPNLAQSPQRGAVYPIEPRITTTDPENGETVVFQLRALRDDQEMNTRLGGPTYWEGACVVFDAAGREIGNAYLELVGYAPQRERSGGGAVRSGPFLFFGCFLSCSLGLGSRPCPRRAFPPQGAAAQRGGEENPRPRGPPWVRAPFFPLTLQLKLPVHTRKVPPIKFHPGI